MPDYRRMYFELAAKVADAIELLAAAQQSGEEDYCEDEKCPVALAGDGK